MVAITEKNQLGKSYGQLYERPNDQLQHSLQIVYLISNGIIKLTDLTIPKDLLKTLMKDIFEEEFEKQQKLLLNLISRDFNISKIEVKKV